ncbi:MAG: hypothetical protein ACI4J2_13125 [Ruminococcus sp.]
METRRMISLLIAAVVALLIIYAGKSCAQDIVETNHKASVKASPDFTGYMTDSSLYNSIPDDAYYTDPSASTAPSVDEGYEIVTNIFGDAVGTIPVTNSDDESGSGNNNENTAETTVKSILGNYTKETTEPVTTVTGKDLNELVLHIN